MRFLQEEKQFFMIFIFFYIRHYSIQYFQYNLHRASQYRTVSFVPIFLNDFIVDFEQSMKLFTT